MEASDTTQGQPPEGTGASGTIAADPTAGADTTTATAPELTQEQKDRIEELDSLKGDRVIDQDQYDTARAKVEAGEPLHDPNAAPNEWGNTGENLPPGPSADAMSAAGADQGGEKVPEVRPQAFQGTPGAGVSDASQRLDNNDPPTAEQIAAANSEENKQAATDASQFPVLEVGQRVQIIGDHSEAGRMAYVTHIVYEDPIQEMLAAVGTPARRFANVQEYVVRTRDGRTDTLTATREQLQPLEENQGWGRGSI